MFRIPGDDLTQLIKLLVQNLTGFEEETPVFSACSDYILTNLQKAESLFFLKKKDIDVQILGQADKFEFHGFKPQADQLRKCYSKFIPESVPKSELHHKLMIMKFLICLSESPTKSFLENPDRGKVTVEESEEEIDWGVLLREGCEKWSPNYSSSSDEWSDDSTQIDSDTIQNTQLDDISRIKNDLDVTKSENAGLNYDEIKKKLCESVQNGWFNRNVVQEVPQTSNIDGNVAFLWDDYVRETTHSLLDQHSTIISEYKVMREIIWQLMIAHSSTCFDYNGRVVSAKEGVTISSVRSVAFTDFLSEFTKTINIMHSFREFRASLNQNNQDHQFPGIYVTYSESVKEIISPFMTQVVTIEDEIRKQESQMTLLKLSHKLRDLFENISILKRIHDEVIIDYKINDPLECSTNLLSRLRYGLANNITSKLELDVYLSLYVGSLHRYLQIIYWWFNNDNLRDVYDEFIIGERSESRSFLNLKSGSDNVFCLYSHESCSSDSDLAKTDSSRYFYKKDFNGELFDNFFGIISSKVVEIGNNIRFLRKLGKITLLNSKISGDLYDDFIERLLKKISIYFKIEIAPSIELQDNLENSDFSAMCSDYVKYPLDLDKLENVVQKSNEFLMETFKPFFEPKKFTPPKPNLFQKITFATKSVFPAEKFVDEAFEEVLNERYGQSGQIIRDLFKSEYKIEEHFELLNHLYLLKDGVITPWYQRLLKQMDETFKIESPIWLTGRLQDLLMDLFPVLHEKCFVKVSQGGLRGTPIQHALNACKLIEIEYNVDWPIDVVIQDYDIEMYKEVFQLILEVKWALYSLTHMFFSEIEPKIKTIKQHKAVTILLRRLKVCRFLLINQFSGIQHYIFGAIITNASVKFEKNLKEASNLGTLSMAHRNFINDIHKSAVILKEYNSKSFGFSYLLYLVNKLKSMWSNLEKVEEQELTKLEKSSKICYKNLEKVMNAQIPGNFF